MPVLLLLVFTFCASLSKKAMESETNPRGTQMTFISFEVVTHPHPELVCGAVKHV